jgi:hypothetical protein
MMLAMPPDTMPSTVVHNQNALAKNLEVFFLQLLSSESFSKYSKSSRNGKFNFEEHFCVGNNTALHTALHGNPMLPAVI